MSENVTPEPAQASPEAGKESVQPAPEAKAPEAAKPAEKPAEGAKPESEAPQPAKPIVPEKYDLKLPEGSLLEASEVEKVAILAKEKGLSNEQAQLLLENKNQAVADFAHSRQTLLNKQVETWKVDAEKDPELGGEAFKANAELATRVVDRFGSKEFRDALNESGLGNHPELLRTFVRIGKAMAEDKLIVPGEQTGKTERSVAEMFYPNMKKE